MQSEAYWRGDGMGEERGRARIAPDARHVRISLHTCAASAGLAPSFARPTRASAFLDFFKDAATMAHGRRAFLMQHISLLHRLDPLLGVLFDNEAPSAQLAVGSRWPPYRLHVMTYFRNISHRCRCALAGWQDGTILKLHASASAQPSRAPLGNNIPPCRLKNRAAHRRIIFSQRSPICFYPLDKNSARACASIIVRSWATFIDARQILQIASR